MEFVTVAGDWVYVEVATLRAASKAIRALDDAGNIIIEIVPLNIEDGVGALLVRTGSDVKLPKPA